MGVLTFFERKSVREQFCREELFKRNKFVGKCHQRLVGLSLWGNVIFSVLFFLLYYFNVNTIFFIPFLGKWWPLWYLICEWRYANLNAQKDLIATRLVHILSIQPNHPQSFENRVSQQDGYWIKKPHKNVPITAFLTCFFISRID